MCCALFIGDNSEWLIFYDFFFRSVRIATYGANGGERVKATYRVLQLANGYLNATLNNR